MTNIIKVQKSVDPTCFLTIIPRGEKFTINVTSGTIENPSKQPNATWWNLFDKYHTLDDVKKVLGMYKIETDIDSLINL
jgi:hypothetical protein